MNSERKSPLPLPASPFSIDLRNVTLRRLAGINRHELKVTGGAHAYCVAVPASYGDKPKARYPLLLLLDSGDLFGSVVEMVRLMELTRESRECIVISLETGAVAPGDVQALAGCITAQLLPQCRKQYRSLPGPVAVFGGEQGLAGALAQSAGAEVLQALAAEDDTPGDADPLPTFVSGLRRHFGTGHAYGSEMLPLGSPVVCAVLGLLRPLFARLRPAAVTPAGERPHVIHSETMNRDFEIFAVAPASAAAHPFRRYPALLVLDANIELSIAAETSARLARRGEIDEVMVIGIGIPRSEGMMEFGFRRFEEYCPPPNAYHFDDHLGRVFRSLFATRGDDARRCVGKAPQLYQFLAAELLPLLAQQLPINTGNLGILGHSAGGAFVSYALNQAQSPFHNYAAISPGAGMSGSWLLREPQSSRPLASAARQAYFCVGGDELSNRFCQTAGIPETGALSRQVQQRQPALKLSFQNFPGETHSTVYARGVAAALRALYGNAH